MSSASDTGQVALQGACPGLPRSPRNVCLRRGSGSRVGGWGLLPHELFAEAGEMIIQPTSLHRAQTVVARPLGAKRLDVC